MANSRPVLPVATLIGMKRICFTRLIGLQDIIAGGGAGMMEALACHPLGQSLDLFLSKTMLMEVSRHDKSPNAVGFGTTSGSTGLAAGITEAVTVVTPMEVLKVRLQAQQRSSTVSSGHKYRNTAHAIYTIAKEEGPRALYSGMSLTAARQATNVSVNLTTYHKLKGFLLAQQPAYASSELPKWQTLLIGLVAGAMGPISNAPIDTISNPPPTLCLTLK
ncbi:MAG: hypothetical protein Q9190_003645 [Brigantiaea leucoxantha]